MSELAREPRYIGTLYDRSLGRLIPRTHFFAMLFWPLFDTFFYFLSTFVAEHSEKGSFALPIDGMIPLLEEFILIYFGCYLFWFGGLLFMACHKTDVFWDFFARVFVSLIVAFSFFMLMPLEITRPEITGDGFFADAMRFLYTIDKPHNLFPSLHCFFNWIVYVQMRGKKEYPLALRLFGCIFSLLVFASTLFTRQHFVMDVVGGVLLAELSALVLKTPLPRFFGRIFEGFDRFLFTKKQAK